MMNLFVRKNMLVLIGVAAGTLGGWIYWKWVGCASGSCAITSDPLIALLMAQ